MEAQSLLLRKTLSGGGGGNMAALLMKHITKEKKKLGTLSSSVKTNLTTFHTQRGRDIVHLAAPAGPFMQHLVTWFMMYKLCCSDLGLTWLFFKERNNHSPRCVVCVQHVCLCFQHGGLGDVILAHLKNFWLLINFHKLIRTRLGLELNSLTSCLLNVTVFCTMPQGEWISVHIVEF